MQFMADFETCHREQEDGTFARVWLWSVGHIMTEKIVGIDDCIDSFMEYMTRFVDCIVYFHNLKFDGSFIVHYLLKHGFRHEKSKEERTFYTVINGMGLWYSITVNFAYDSTVTFLDSVKILPMKMSVIMKEFCGDVEIKKGVIDYRKWRDKGDEVSKREIDYIKDDVLGGCRALKKLFQQGFTKRTASSNSIERLKGMYDKSTFNDLFVLKDVDENEFCQRSKKGGITLCVPNKQQNISGVYCDFKQMYASVMKYKFLPYGQGVRYKGTYVEDKDYPLFIEKRIVILELREGYIPCYLPKGNGKTYPNKYIIDSYELEDDGMIEIVATSVEWELLEAHYVVDPIEYLGGYKYKGKVGLFGDFIDDVFSKREEERKKGNEGVASYHKLTGNGLYGKMGTNRINRMKTPIFEDEVVKFPVNLMRTEYGNIYHAGISSFISAYARTGLMEKCQPNVERYYYSDTDSGVFEGDLLPIGAVEDDGSVLGDFRVECRFDKGFFFRPKTYIFHKIGDKEKVYKVACAGLPDNARRFVFSFVDKEEDCFSDRFVEYLLWTEEREKILAESDYTWREKDDDKTWYFCLLTPFEEEVTEVEILGRKLRIEWFRIGLELKGVSLQGRQVNGGMALVEKDFKLRNEKEYKFHTWGRREGEDVV